MSTFKIVLTAIFAVCIVIGIAIFALYKGDSDENSANLTIWGTMPSETFDVAYKNSSLQANKSIKVAYVKKDQAVFDEEFVEALAEGKGPDIVILREDAIYKQRNKLFIIPYKSYSERDFKDKFIEEGELFLSPEGIAAFPLTIDPLVMYWNRDKFSNNLILSDSPNPPSIDEVVEGTVLSIEKARVLIDIPPFGTGIIYGREYINARDIIKKINIGDSVAGKVISIDNKDGYIEISLKEARQALIWNEAENAIVEKKIFELPVQEANKGGLMLSWQGISGFLPASQLKTEHYPRVADGDKDKILEELRKLVGQKISVAIIGVSPKEGKLIFSEKNPEQKNKNYIIDKYALGDEVTGEITGVVDFGLFVKLEDGLEGLVHISEIDWALVENPKLLFHIGEKVRVKVIEIKDGKISLSIKALKENPWKEAEKKYKKDDAVDAVIIKFNKHGALASIEEGISGLVHISEFGSEEKLHDKLELGKSYKFKISMFDAKEQKMTLNFVDKDN